MSLTLSFLGGIVSAFTPCVIVLMPILLYRFFHERESEWEKFGLFIFGFLLFYVIFGYVLSSLFTSSIQNGLRIGLGLLFILLGGLAVIGRLNPLHVPIIKNSFLFGGVFALITSFNPCTIPYLGVIISIESKAMLFLNLLSFGLGLIVPALLFAFFGKRILNVGKGSGKVFNRVNSIMHYILILSGMYLMFSINVLHKYDVYIISVFLMLCFYILIKSFFVINSFSDMLKVRNILLLLSLVLILVAAVYNCNSYVSSYENVQDTLGLNKDNVSCSIDVSTCVVCRRCIYIFSIASILGFLGIGLIRLKNGKDNK
jgi:cytochrome c-type biogenesis protein